MGIAESKSEELKVSLNLFTAYEKEQIKKIFAEISGGTEHFNEQQLKKYLSRYLPDILITRLYKAISELRHHKHAKHDHISHDTFVVAMAHLLKSTITQRSRIVHCLASDEAGDMTAQQLVSFNLMLVEAYMKIAEESPQCKTWKISTSEEANLKLAKALLRSTFNKVKVEGSAMDLVPEGVTYTEGDIETWLSTAALFLHIMDHVMYTCFTVSYVEEGAAASFHSPKIPYAIDVNWSKTSTMLDIPSLLYINHVIPAEHRGKWRQLFYSDTHGESFATLMKRITKQGPTVIIIRDKDGYVFGGFASTGWECRPQFVGTSRCFLFHLLPHYAIYYASGYNDHYMYLNQSQQTMPNGLGMGGQMEHFGLWLDCHYGQGYSYAKPLCTTYQSPQLSMKKDFEIDLLEVWGVGKKPGEELGEDGPQEKQSILDVDPEAKAMLSLLGRGPVSEGLREADPEASNPEEHNRNF
ncbi:TLD domain-containing protein 1 isoform X2 [Lingula anatina]|uniref:MTOR-associated protein MEAK7 n=1 Tax=Lingula anatina TaxID=7574 RepID=A0A1S3H6K3_LINAN|nr:TLD domain-containing protein 1 isoform X2 [Lingula anatina]|eukprot:XP_013380759.1 TLD domain-containing protein 1 isoform X2 [Lingula anatina]